MAPKTNISWMTPSETLLRLGLGGFGDVKYFFLNFVFSGPCFEAPREL